MTIVFIPKESRVGEARVAAVPETVERFIKAGAKVRIDSSAGLAAGNLDEQYRAAGAEVLTDGEASKSAWSEADLVLKVQPPTKEEAELLRKDSVLVSFVMAQDNPAVVRQLADAGVMCFAMELVPRISRAQVMDALSSQATVAGYKAALLAASALKKLCPLLMTAAGTVRPARAVVFGAGVAGLQVIATLRRLGCVVEATDVRLAAKEQVESLGASFIEVPGAEDMEDAGGYAKEATEEFLNKQREEVAKRVAEADIVVTTAQIPGRKAPVLVSPEMVESMKAGSVIVDMAVESGGNCTLSKVGETVEHNGVSVLGPVNLPASLPKDASDLYSKNVFALTKLMLGEEGKLEPNLEDEVLAGCLLTHAGKIAHEATAKALEQEVTA